MPGYIITTKSLSTDDDTAYGPYLLPPFVNPVLPSPFVIYVPNVANNINDHCDINDNSDFSLTWITYPPGQQTIYAKVTVQTANMVTDDPSKRATLKQNFALFRQSLENLENNQCILPGAANIITNRVAAMLVLRFDEILYYYYGFDPTAGIELSAGMTLQIEAGTFQYVAPYGSSLPGASLDAFASVGQSYYTVGLNNQNQTLSFNSYLARLTPYGITPSRGPAANIIDLTSSGMARRHWRLVYPTQFVSTTNITQDPQLQYNVALLGADTLNDLAMAVEAYINTSTCAMAQSPDNSILCIYFAGRASVVPLIPIIFQQAPYYVPIGTTFRNLLQTFMIQSSGDLATFFPYPRLSLLYRYNVAGLSNFPPVNLKTVSLPISIDSDPLYLEPVSETGLTIWDFPFVLRDEVSWAWNQVA